MWERREKCTRFWWGSLKRRDHSDDKLGWEDGIEVDLQEIGWVGGPWSRFIWLRIETSGSLLWRW
jgi:hypothetical protein